MKINSDYIVIKELDLKSFKNKLFIPKKYDGESRFAEVIATSAGSIFNKGDIILHERDIRLFKANDLGEGKFYILEREVSSKIVEDTILTVRDFVYVKAEADSKHEVKFNNLTIKIDAEFNPFDDNHVTRSGEVLSAPIVATNSYTGKEVKVEIEKGDEIYTHHFLTHEQSETEINGQKVYEVRYEDCYCVVRDGEIVMLNEWNLLEAINESEEDIKVGRFFKKFQPGTDSKLGVLKHSCLNLRNLGVKIDDVVVFKRNRDYVITVGDKKYFRVNTRDIVATK